MSNLARGGVWDSDEELDYELEYGWTFGLNFFMGRSIED